jgi:feruloyl esterase
MCENGGDDCFTTAQVDTLKTLAGGVTVKGQTVFPGVLPGTEGIDAAGVSGWEEWVISEKGPSRQLAYGDTFVKNMAMLPASGKDIDWKRYDFDTQYEKTVMVRGLVDADDPDLSAFHKRGGRMITYFGWSDPALNPLMGVDYYESVRKTMGAEKVADFYRMFMVPGMFHCRMGYGTDTFDAFTPLMDWVENGKAPDVIEAKKIVADKTTMTRPLCPYPQAAKYSGSGDINDGANFACQAP